MDPGRTRMASARNGILFLCVANSARSQMAEGLARGMAEEDVEVFSAGSEPATVNPFAVRAMAELGIDLSAHHSKSVDDIPAERIAVAVTLCAEEVCPPFPAGVRLLQWPHPDPAAAQGGDEEVMASFRSVRDQIQAKLQDLFADPLLPA